MNSPVNFWNHYLMPMVRARNRKPPGVIVNEIIRCYRTYRRFPRQYFRLGLYLDFIEADVCDYIPKRFIYEYQIKVNGAQFPEEITEKLIFARIMEKYGLPVVREYFSTRDGTTFTAPNGATLTASEALARISMGDGQAFVKPVSGRKGADVSLFDAGKDRLEDVCTPGNHLLFQPVVRQHPALHALNPSAVNTLRLATVRSGGDITIVAAVLRVGRDGNIVDNSSLGGMTVPIDLQTGALGRYARTKVEFQLNRLDRHPDTNVAFAEIVIPFWSEVCDLVRRGAEAFVSLGTIGWDIAITPDGPVVIEANGPWGVEVFQLGQPLGRTEIGRLALAYHREATGRALTLPPLKQPV